MELHRQPHRSGPGSPTGGEIKDRRGIVQVCVTPTGSTNAAMPVPQELLCSFQEHFTCRAAEDLGLSKLLSPPASSVWGWDWIFTPSPLGYPGKAAAVPVLQESCQGCCIRSGRPRFSCARLRSHCLLWAEPRLSPILPFPRTHRSCCSVHLSWMCSRWD